ncbi:MFS transporter [Microbacterium sp. HJ5]
MTISTTPVPASDSATRFPLRALTTLGLGVFVTVTAESLPAGLMPEMSADLGVSPVQTGLLISVWAATVILTSIPLARATVRFDRRLVVAGSLAAFALANVATALAPTYEVVVGTRVAAAVAHGVFWSVVIVYATALLSPSHLGRGLAVVTAGGTAATVVGLPLAALLAQAWGWRPTFVILASIALAVAAAVVRDMPSHFTPRPASTDRDRGFWRDPSLPALAAFGLAAILIAIAQFASFTYIRPYLEISASIEAEWAAALLFVYGAAGIVGVAVAGFLADRFPRASLTGILVLFAAVFAVLTVAASSAAVVVGALVAWGFALGAMFPLLQTTLMRVSTERTRTLASAGIVVLFNIGIAVGPWVGGLTGGDTTPTATTAVSASAMVVATAIGVAGLVLAGRRMQGDRRAG